MQATVIPQQRQATKREIVRLMKQGASTHEARVRSIVSIHRTTVYRLRKRVQSEDESAWSRDDTDTRSSYAGTSSLF
jgi:hypothetical protein